MSAFACLAAACTSPASSTGRAVQSGDELRYYDREAFTVVMTYTGAITGTTTRYVRDWGRQQAIVNDMVMSAGGLASSYRNRVVMEGARIVTIDETGATLGETLADYEQNWAEWRGRTAMERFERQMPNIGARRTGASGSFAGQVCDYWETQSIGMRDCVTSWGLTLYESNTIANVSESVATEVRMGDSGPDSAFAYDASQVIERAECPSSYFPGLNCE